MLEYFNRVLVLAPHTDDGEFGCGGTIARLIDEGKNVHYVAFSSAEESVPEHLDQDVLKREVKIATSLLGIKPENLTILGYPVRHFPQHRQDILEELVKLNRQISPDLVLLPSTNDVHQDHLTIAQEGIRAFKKTTVLAYEVPWNNFTFNNSGFVSLTQDHVNKKIQALACYESQKGRAYASVEFINGLAITRGTQVDAKFAEVFDVIRWIAR